MKILELMCYAFAGLGAAVHVGASTIIIKKTEDKVVVLGAKVKACEQKHCPECEACKECEECPQCPECPKCPKPTVTTVENCTTGLAPAGHYFTRHGKLVAPTTHGEVEFDIQIPHVQPIEAK